MNETDKLTRLLTGYPDSDARIRAAYELGLSKGKASDRENVRANAKIQTTKQLLNSLMATQGIDLQAAMIALRIPRAERKTYVKIFSQKARK